MIFVTGDCHGDYRRFNRQIFPEQQGMTKSDYVIICGDFGYVTASKETDYWLRWLEEKSYTTLWVDGNHENYDLLKTLPVEEWHGGRVQKLRPSVIHLMRGQVYEINGLKLFAFGGARSHDIEGGILQLSDPLYRRRKTRLKREKRAFRTLGLDWWPEEMPSAEEMAEGIHNLERHHWQVDLTVSHCCATSLQNSLDRDEYVPDPLTDYLEEIRSKLSYRYWFFGHYHDNRQLGEKDFLLYEQIVVL